MTTLTRRYRFSASHRLHAAGFTEEENRELYGKCNNPYGHGHNYTLEVSVRGEVDGKTGQLARPAVLDELVGREVLAELDHRSLNEEIAAFSGGGEGMVPTTENLAAWIEQTLQAGWRTAFPDGKPELCAVRVLETKRNSFELRT